MMSWWSRVQAEDEAHRLCRRHLHVRALACACTTHATALPHRDRRLPACVGCSKHNVKLALTYLDLGEEGHTRPGSGSSSSGAAQGSGTPRALPAA